MKYKFEIWHLIVGIILLALLFNSQNIGRESMFGRGYDITHDGKLYSCDSNPIDSESKDYDGKTSISHTNIHTFPVTFELFNEDWTYINRKEVMPGETKSFTGLDSSKTYHKDIYWCELAGEGCDGANEGQYKCSGEGEISICDDGNWDSFGTCSNFYGFEDECKSSGYVDTAREACEEADPECTEDYWICSGAGYVKQCHNGEWETPPTSFDRCTDWSSTNYINDCIIDNVEKSKIENVCKESSVTIKYSCVGGSCEVSSTGTSLSVCQASCGGSGTSTTLHEPCWDSTEHQGEIGGVTCTGNEVCTDTGVTYFCMDLTSDSCTITCTSLGADRFAKGYCTINECRVGMSSQGITCYTNRVAGFWNKDTSALECVNCIQGAQKVDPLTGPASCCSKDAVGIGTSAICTFPIAGEPGSTYTVGTLEFKENLVPSTQKSKLKDMTSGNLLQHVCGGPEDCAGTNVSCISMASLSADGYLLEATKQGTMSTLKDTVAKGAIYSVVGATAGFGLCVGAASIIGIGTGGAGLLLLPICGTFTFLGGAAGGAISLNTDKLAEAAQLGNDQAIGVCISTGGDSVDLSMLYDWAPEIGNLGKPVSAIILVIGILFILNLIMGMTRK